jgi:muramoyltetrapeptide carboxypeptidase
MNRRIFLMPLAGRQRRRAGRPRSPWLDPGDCSRFFGGVLYTFFVHLNKMPFIPERLRPGDTVGLIAPASAPADPDVIDRSAALLEQMGFTVQPGRHVRKRWGFLAGKDEERAGDLMRMFADRRVRGIFCVRGGYGAARLLPRLDYAAIARHPKALIGYSDITSLHCALLKKSNLLSFHSPMMASDLLRKDCPQFSLDSLWQTITQPVAPGSICDGYRKKTVSVIRRGKVSGELIGGNLSVLCTLIGTPYQPVFRGKILFLEEVDEKPYRIDGWLTHLANSGVLRQVAGVAVGVCQRCVDPKARGKEYRQTVEDVLLERLGPLKVPVVIGLPFGHVPHNATLPVGGRVTLDGDEGDLIVTQAVVR